MTRFWRWWVALWSRRERGTTLALFRIAVAGVILGSLLSALFCGVVTSIWYPRAQGGINDARSNFWLLDLLGGAQPEVVWGLTIGAMICATLMMLGFGGRWMVLATICVYRSVSSIGYFTGSYDLMISNACWLLFLSRPTATLSIDCRRKHGRWGSDELVAAWPRYLVIAQLVLIYTATGIQKTSAAWSFDEGYAALFYFLQDPKWIRFDMQWTAWVYPVLQGATATVWYFEAFAPLLLVVLFARDRPDTGGRWRRWLNRFDLRKAWAAFGIGMHLGIAALMSLGPFSWISISYYLCLMHPDEVPTVRFGRRS